MLSWTGGMAMTLREEYEQRWPKPFPWEGKEILLDTENDFVYMGTHGVVGWSRQSYTFWRNRNAQGMEQEGPEDA